MLFSKKPNLNLRHTKKVEVETIINDRILKKKIRMNLPKQHEENHNTPLWE
jgi:hypothetical protein